MNFNTPKKQTTTTTTTTPTTTTTTQKQLNTPQSNRIPISLNPKYNETGLVLGRKRLLERIRINLISLLLVWLLTSTHFYNEIILSISSKIPLLSVPLQVIEWLFLVIIIGNLIEGYYKLKTQVAITHVELPLTPQQKRGSVFLNNHHLQYQHQSSGNNKKLNNRSEGGILSPQRGNNLSPFQRSQNTNLTTSIKENNNKSICTPTKTSSTTTTGMMNEESPTMYKTRGHMNYEEILTKDPMMNPLKSSTNHLFKRSIFNNNNNLQDSTSSSSNQPENNINQSNFLRHSFPSSYSSSFNNNNNNRFNTPSPANNHNSFFFRDKSSVRNVSNSDSLHKLLEETFAAS